MTLVVVLSVGSHPASAPALRVLLDELDSSVPILLAGTADDVAALSAVVVAAGDRVAPAGASGVTAWNRVAQEHPAADLLLVGAEVEIGSASITAMAVAAQPRGEVATVTALSNNAGFLSVPRRNLPWPIPANGASPARIAGMVREACVGLEPAVIPVALPHAALVTRPAIDLLGAFEADRGPAASLAEFSARAVARGMRNVVAPAAFAADREVHASAHAITDDDIAGQVDEAAGDRSSALSRLLLSVSVALEPLSVTIDARSLSAGVGGTSAVVAGLIGALDRREDVRLRVLSSARSNERSAALLASLRGEVLDEQALDGALARTHVAHRPSQPERREDLQILDLLGERSVVTILDLIAYRTPAVHPDAETWIRYRETIAEACAFASAIVTSSEHTRRDLVTDDLVGVDRTHVVRFGVAVGDSGPAQRPNGVSEEDTFIVQLGARFRHKNTPFSIALLKALRRRGWEGKLVLAGPEVLHGSSAAEDAAALLSDRELSDAVIELGSVGEGEKRWLLEQAVAVLYPSTYEGFGLIPFEAAHAGTPILTAPVTAIAETLPPEATVLEPWNADRSADRVLALLDGGSEDRTQLVSRVQAAADALTWERCADGLDRAYRAAVGTSRPPQAATIERIARLEHDYWDLRDRLDDAAWSLVNPETGLLGPHDRTQLVRALAGGSRIATVRAALGARKVRR